MSFLRNITLLICTASLIYTAVLMLVPDRFRREIRSVLALAAAVAVGAVITNADLSDLSGVFGEINMPQSLESRDSLIQEELEERLCDYLESLLSEQGINVKKLTVGTTIDGQRRISITDAGIELDSVYRERESEIRALIGEKIGEIEVKISYED